jgi:hypothetical protein
METNDGLLFDDYGMLMLEKLDEALNVVKSRDASVMGDYPRIGNLFFSLRDSDVRDLLGAALDVSIHINRLVENADLVPIRNLDWHIKLSSLVVQMSLQWEQDQHKIDDFVQLVMAEYNLAIASQNMRGT